MPIPIPEVGTGVPRQAIVSQWQTNRCIDLTGVASGALAYALTALQQESGRPIVVVESNAKSAALTAENLRAFSPASNPDMSEGTDIIVFPSYEMGLYEEVVPDKTSSLRRTAFLFRLLQKTLPFRFAVLPADALLRRVVPRSRFESACQRVCLGEQFPRQTLVSLLEQGGYHHTPVVEEPGTYSVRGALVDIFVPSLDTPLRLDFFGDELESIRRFDAETQLRKEAITQFWIHPAQQNVTPTHSDDIRAVEARMRALCDSVNCPTLKTELLIQDMLEGRTFIGSHSFLPALYPGLDSMLDYFTHVDFCIVNPASLKLEWLQTTMRSETEFDHKRSLHIPVFPPAQLLLSETEWTTRLQNKHTIRVHPLEIEGTPEGADPDCAVPSYLNLHTTGFGDLRQKLTVQAEQLGSVDILDALAEQMQHLENAGYQTVLVCHTSGQKDRMTEMLSHRDIALKPWNTSGFQGEGSYVHQCPLVHGFLWPAEGICFITEEEIFGKSSYRRKGHTRPKEVFFDLTTLAPGDLVVHKEHGVGRYEGLVHQVVRDVGMDFLLICYRGDDKLYLPVYRLSQIQKYKSATDTVASLDKLGGVTFSKTKATARKRAMLLAAKLLEIYARKELTTRPAVEAEDDLYLAFESAFPYDETEDQISVISEVMSDLESERPMDRLLCGDVGFGKTEVALRAAFRMVNSGRQVAILVPTTVLAQQHYLNFKKRFAPYPVRVEMLSRFRTTAQNANVAAAVKEGRVDIVVGTHRLLSADVHFKNLGLLVVDEEHRFGVAHKERIRSLRTTVDTLAMTATPIPRTLHMAFSKLRDLSIISTPPVNRHPIKTLICHDDSTIIKEAILRELARDGQVYFVHNRVKDIQDVAQRITRLVPSARVGIGHGQMKEDALEQVMRDFIDGRYDVLVSTAIIESGLDIPRANTMLIDRADTFGLAQLYQIRGRVGRSDVQAYAYLIVPPVETLTSDARERVEALARHTALGSGFQVASMDLEIRGAGNLLGAEQSGDVDGVGFEMYMELLEEATARLKGEDYETAFEPEINLDTPGFLPQEYIEDVGLRLHYYKELATSRTEYEVNQIAATLVDRFGPLPSDALSLIDGMIARTLCRSLGILGMETTKKKITLHMGANASVHPDSVIALIRQGEGTVRLTKDFKIIAVRADETQSPTDFLRQLQKAK